MTKKFTRAMLGLMVGIAGSIWVNSAQAIPVLWTLQDVVFNDQSTASGTFVYDATTDMYSSIDLSTSNGNTYMDLRGGGSDFAFFLESRPADLSGIRALPMGFQADLTNAGGTIDLIAGSGVFSGEGICNGSGCGSVGFFRFFASGQVTTQPTTVNEPATLAILSLGLAGLGFARRRKAA